MASTQVSNALAQAKGLPDPSAAYKHVLSDIKNLSSPATITADLVAIADTVLGAGLGVVATRALLAELVMILRSHENHAAWIDVGTHVVGTIGESTSLASSLVEQAAALRELVATAYEAQEDFGAAARMLAEVPLDSSQRRVGDAGKAAVWIRIVRNYLEVDDNTAAETYLNKLKNVIHNVVGPAGENNTELALHFKLSAARIQDGKRQFLAAAQSYHDISFSPAVAEEERLHTLSMAIKCAVLAPAGPPRSRVLARLYKDERCASLDEFSMLEKMFLDRLLSRREVDKFAQGLVPHQLAITSDGSTVLARAVVEHNLLAASRIYSNMSFVALGRLLDLDGDKAEDTTARMIEQGRLAGSIDQIDRIIYFVNDGEPSAERASARPDVIEKATRTWDHKVQVVAESVEELADALRTQFPAFAEAHLQPVM